MLLDEFIPQYQFNEVHAVRLSAPPERALEAVKRVTPSDIPLVRLLFTVRSLPALFTGRRGLPTAKTESLYEQMLDFGFVFLGEDPGREVVCGVIGQMWKVRGTAPTIRDAREFVAFEEPSYAKAAMNFSVWPVQGGTWLHTETRVLIADDASRSGFGRYWRVIRPGSAMIRRSWLRAAKRWAESRAREKNVVA
jgi:hypothetical protein